MEMNIDWYQAHCKVAEILTLKLTPITQTPGVVVQEAP